jgi:drug/metabolite transporter (DMT)-like permease
MAGRDGLTRPWAFVVLTVAMAIAAGNPVVGRAVVAEVPPVALTFWRFIAAVVVLGLFGAIPLWRQRALFLRHWKMMLAMGAPGIAGYNAFLYLGVQTTTAINAALITATVPVVVVAMIAVVHRERVSVKLALGMTIGLFGVGVTVMRGDITVLLNLAFVPGDLLMLVAVFGFSFYSLLLRDLPKGLNPVAFMLVIHTIALITVAPFYAWEISVGITFVPSGGAVAAILYVGVMATAVSFSMYNWAVSAVGVGSASQFIYLAPVFASLMAVAFLGETFRGFHLVGVILIFGGIYVATRRSRAAKPGAAA